MEADRISATARPAGRRIRTFVYRYAVPAEAVWPILSDTARFNEAAKLSKHEIEEIPRDDGSVLYLGRARIGPFALEWDDRPANWVANRWLEHCRVFRAGPLKLLRVRLTLIPEGAGCCAEYKVDAAPANLLGRLMLATRFFAGTEKMFMTLAADAARFTGGASPAPFDYASPDVASEVRARVDSLVAQIEESGRGHGLVRRLADHVLTAQEVDLVHIRPLELAHDWAVDERHAIELCLESARAGLLDLHWQLLCPRCRIGKADVATLDLLPTGAHCGTCNISYDRDFSRNVEATFTPVAQIRSIPAGEYCLFGPMSTPHIWAHITLATGQSRRVEVDLRPSAYRLRTLEPGPERDLNFAGGGFPEVVVEDDAIEIGRAAPLGELVLTNRSRRPVTAIVEEVQWMRDALTADRVTALQAFRDLFSDQALRPGDEVGIGRVALMFTDLRASTALYESVGDARAYHLVRDHFAFLAGIVRDHNGAVIKTIGDAIMAAFSDPADAVRAALQVQREVAAFNATSGGAPLIIKLGLHEGPYIAVTLNSRLDYFGTVVNMAARLQAQSEGGDIVLSKDVAADPAIPPLLDGLELRPQTVALKGYDAPVAFYRLKP